jgi:hypothetical protein
MMILMCRKGASPGTIVIMSPPVREMPGEVSQVSAIPPPVSTSEALGMLRAAMGFLNAADAAQMMTGEQARCLRVLEQVSAMGTAARTSILAAFTCGQGYSADADYSPRAWLIHKTGITKGAAAGHTAWVRRATSHPQVAQALAEGEMSESVARAICQWTEKLPGDCRRAADAILVTAAKAGMDLRDLAELAREIRSPRRAIGYARILSQVRPAWDERLNEDRGQGTAVNTGRAADRRAISGH